MITFPWASTETSAGLILNLLDRCFKVIGISRSSTTFCSLTRLHCAIDTRQNGEQLRDDLAKSRRA